MSVIGNFLAVTRVFREATGMKVTVLSWRLFGDSKKLGRLMNGADIQVTRYEKALQWLSDQWPDHAVWPPEVPRPDRSPPDAEPAPADAPNPPEPLSPAGAATEAA